MADSIAAMFTTPEMTAVFSPRAHVQRMLDFEAALARAQARAGLVPAEAARAIADACSADQFDVAALYAEAVSAGTLAIPLARELAARAGAAGGRYVHWGATSQDAVDTATVLQIRDALEILDARLLAGGRACRTLVERHRAVPMVGRTLLQQALPITFGLKAARWLALIARRIRALRALRASVLVVQFGGAAGTHAALGSDGMRVMELLADELALGVPELPWHAERDRVADLGAALGVTAGSVAKIATDLVLLAQTEVGEVSEGAADGKGGSSTLPQKRNPVESMEALAAARLAVSLAPALLGSMDHAHERAVGQWQAEWVLIPNLFQYTDGAIDRVRAALAGLQVDAGRMADNLDLSRGLVMAESLATALAAHLGRPAAQDAIRTAAMTAIRERRHLLDVALSDPTIGAVLSADEIAAALDPRRYLGSAAAFVDRALGAFHDVEHGGDSIQISS